MKDEDVLAHMKEIYARTGELPRYRDLQARFSAGPERIRRLRRHAETELGMTSARWYRRADRGSTDGIDPAAAQRLLEAIDQLTQRLEERATAIQPAAPPTASIDWQALRASWDYLGERGGDIHLRLNDLVGDQERVADRIVQLHRLVEDRQYGLTAAADALVEDARAILKRQDEAVRELLRAAKAAAGARRHEDASAIEKRLDSFGDVLKGLQAGQQQLAGTVQRLSEQTARKHHGLDAAADRLEEAARTLTLASDSTEAQQSAAVQRLETAAGVLDRAASDAAARAKQDLAAERSAISQAFEPRLKEIDQKLTGIAVAIQDAPESADVDLQGEIRALGGDVGTQLADLSATIGKAIDRQRRAGDRAAARAGRGLEELLDAVQALGRRRPPRATRLHEDSLQAIDAAIARRLAAAERARKKAAATSSTKSRAPAAKRGAKKGSKR